jgi:hypothetical protein
MAHAISALARFCSPCGWETTAVGVSGEAMSSAESAEYASSEEEAARDDRGAGGASLAGARMLLLDETPMFIGGWWGVTG